MITGDLKRQVDKIWDTLWTAGITSPVTVMEQITYLLFMKLLDDSQLARESNANAFGTAVQDPVFKEGVCVISEQPRIECAYDKLRWSRFSNANPPEMFETVRNYVFEFIKRLGGDEDDTAFGRYMKNAVFLIPTPEVLVSVVDDMSGMQLTDKDTMGDVYEELLKKMAAAGANGQFRTPKHIVDMIVALMKPTLADLIADPAMGSAGFLVSAAQYIIRTFDKELYKPKNRDKFKTVLFSGFDTDQSMLRIGAMNMMLHGVDNPHIVYQDSLSQKNTERDKYTLIMANPPFTGKLFKNQVSGDLLALTQTGKTELLFVSLFTKMLQVGGRCASIVPDGVLFGSSTAHKALRRELVENQRLEAVISMPSGVFKPYAGVSTAILIFTKTNHGGTDNVWFYDMKADGFSLDDKRSPIAENDIPDVIEKFHSKDANKPSDRKAKCFFVPKSEIAENDYDLSINKYKTVEYVAEKFPPVSEILADFEKAEQEIQATFAELKEML